MNIRIWKVTLVSGRFGVREIWVAVKCSIVKVSNVCTCSTSHPAASPKSTL